MSVANEWARRHAQTMGVRPKFECVTWDAYADRDEKDVSRLDVVGLVHESARLHMPGGMISAGDACAFARWILATFGNAETFPASEASGT